VQHLEIWMNYKQCKQLIGIQKINQNLQVKLYFLLHLYFFIDEFHKYCEILKYRYVLADSLPTGDEENHKKIDSAIEKGIFCYFFVIKLKEHLILY
jgi:hypothetical protein